MSASHPTPLLARHASSTPVAVGDAGARTAADLLRDAATVAAALPPPQPGSHIAMVFTSDRYAFAAGLLGIWAAGHAAALPPNQRRDTVHALLGRDDVVGMVHDTQAATGTRIQVALAGPAATPLTAPVLPAREVVATAFTSGSTGEMQAAPKTAQQLFAEVAVQVAGLPETAGSCVVATVPPTHIYGLLFGVLVPLSTGGAMLREIPLLPEAVATRVRDHDARVLVTVPAHLRTLEALAPGALGALTTVISSAAPLPAATAQMVYDRHGLDVHEVFGSTETGGIAHRIQRLDAGWRPLDGASVGVDADGHLTVDSPFLDPSLPRPHATADLAELRADGCFLHRGRADGVVKVGGRRVNLRALEAALSGVEGVDDAAVAAVPEPGGRGVRVLAAVAATESVTVDMLRAALADRFAPATLPRRFVLRPRLPREANGKLVRARLMTLFGLDAQGRPLESALAWTRDAREDVTDGVHRQVFTAHVPERYAHYEGHFASYPVMAGVVQLHEVVLPCVRRARPDVGRLVRLSRLKFLKRISPGDAIDVAIPWVGDGSASVDFAITSAAGTCAGGRLDFAEVAT